MWFQHQPQLHSSISGLDYKPDTTGSEVAECNNGTSASHFGCSGLHSIHDRYSYNYSPDPPGSEAAERNNGTSSSHFGGSGLHGIHDRDSSNYSLPYEKHPIVPPTPKEREKWLFLHIILIYLPASQGVPIWPSEPQTTVLLDSHCKNCLSRASGLKKPWITSTCWNYVSPWHLPNRKYITYELIFLLQLRRLVTLVT